MAAPTRSFPVKPWISFVFQTPKTEATEKFESMTLLPSIGSNVTVYSPSLLSSFTYISQLIMLVVLRMVFLQTLLQIQLLISLDA